MGERGWGGEGGQMASATRSTQGKDKGDVTRMSPAFGRKEDLATTQRLRKKRIAHVPKGREGGRKRGHGVLNIGEWAHL